MALAKQLWPVPLGKGVDTKTDPALVAQPRLLALENATFVKDGALTKRPGAVDLPYPAASGTFRTPADYLAAAGQIPAVGKLALFDDQLLVGEGGSLYSYSKTEQAWANVASLRSVTADASSIHADRFQQSFPDCASAGGFTCYAFESSQGGAYVTVVEEATGTRVRSALVLSADASKPVVVAASGFFYVFYLTGGTKLAQRRIAIGDPSVLQAEVTLLTNLHGTHPYWAAKPYGGDVLVAWSDSTDALNLQYLDGTTGALADASSGFFAPVSIAGPFAGLGCLNLAVVEDTFVLLWALTTSVYAAAYSQALVNTRAAGAVTIGCPYSVTQVTGAKRNLGSSPSRCRVYFECSTTPTYNSRVGFQDVPLDNTFISTAFRSFYRSVGLGSEAWYAPEEGGTYVTLVYDSPIRPVFLVATTTTQVVARLFATRAGGLAGYPRLPQAAALGAGRYCLALPIKGRLVSEARNSVYLTKAISRATLDLQAQSFRSVQLGGTALFTGACAGGHDGGGHAGGVVEQGFHYCPEQPSGACGNFGLKITQLAKTGTAQQTVQITPPADDQVAGPGSPAKASGAKVRPGSYLIVSDAEDLLGAPRRILIWFTVDGVGTLPAGAATGCKGVQVQLQSTNTQVEVTRAIRNAVNSTLLAGNSPGMVATLGTAGTDAVVLVISSGMTTPIAPPQDDTSFAEAVVFIGDATHAEKTRLFCPAASWITAGQWFALESSYLNVPAGIGPGVRVCFYFTVGGVGAAPALPDGCTFLQAINVAATDSPTVVATAVGAAISAYQVGGFNLWSPVIVTGTAVDVACNTNVGAANAFGEVGLTKYGGTRNNNVGGNLDAGDGLPRLYYAVYEWYDTKGQLHRSGVSQPFVAIIGSKDVTGSGSASTDQATHASVQVSVSTLRVSGKASEVQIGVFRTPAGGTVAYRVATLANSTGADSVSFTDTLRDEEIYNADQLYTAGGEVDNDPPPPCTLALSKGGRVFLAGTDDPYAVWYSKPFAGAAANITVSAVSFSEFFQLRVEPAGGKIVALAALGERLVVLQERGISLFDGPGPDATGQNGAFSKPQPVPTDVGCASADSVITTQAGVLFKSSKGGFYLLDQGAGLTYVGAAVKAYEGNDVTSAVQLPDDTRVRFTSSTGPALDFDYRIGEWATHPPLQAAHAVAWKGAYVYLTPDGLARQETPGLFVEGGKPIRMLASTGWLAPAERQGFVRVYRVLLLAAYRGKHKLVVQVAYDYDDTVAQEFAWDAGAALGGNAFGDDEVFGTGLPMGSAGTAVEQLRFHLKRQKCEALRITIFDVPTDNGESLVLQQLALEVGVKRSVYQLPASRSVG
jgi:hypothetical protein